MPIDVLALDILSADLLLCILVIGPPLSRVLVSSLSGEVLLTGVWLLISLNLIRESVIGLRPLAQRQGLPAG